ncbi:hypothetical protein D3C72_1762780 [compost metagenome]
MPPDRSDGILSASRADRPTSCSLSSAARQIRLSGSARSSRSGNAILSITDSAENSAPRWNCSPQRLRSACSCAARNLAGYSPNTLMLPEVGRSSPTIWRSSTVLPLPDPPTIESTSPRHTSRLTWSCTTALPKRLTRLRTSITAVRCAGAGGAAGSAGALISPRP